jgi:hypothetical protein
MQIFTGVCIILIQTQLYRSYRPYIDPRFNNIEYNSQFASVRDYLKPI